MPRIPRFWWSWIRSGYGGTLSWIQRNKWWRWWRRSYRIGYTTILNMHRWWRPCTGSWRWWWRCQGKFITNCCPRLRWRKQWWVYSYNCAGDNNDSWEIRRNWRRWWNWGDAIHPGGGGGGAGGGVIAIFAKGYIDTSSASKILTGGAGGTGYQNGTAGGNGTYYEERI